MEKFSVFACMLMMDVNLKTKDSMYIIHISIFGDVLKKSVLCMGKYGTVCEINYSSCQQLSAVFLQYPRMMVVSIVKNMSAGF